MLANSATTNPVSSETLWVIRDQVRFLGVAPSPGFALLEITVPPGSGTPPHRHESPEIFYMLTGDITFGAFDEDRPQFTRLQRGGCLSVASGRAHNYQNNTTETAVMLVVVNQQMVRFFQDVGKREIPPNEPPSEVEIAEIAAACSRHEIELLPLNKLI